MRIIEFGQHLPEWIGSLLRRTPGQGATQTALGRYTYSQIARICDQALAPNREGLREILRTNKRAHSVYQGLHQEDSPASIVAAVAVGLARAGNLEEQDVDTLRDITYLLPVVDQKYRPFCAAIGQSIQVTEIMARSSRPDFASSQRLAEIAKDSFDAFHILKWERRRFMPYVTSEGRSITSRRKFVSSLRGSEDVAGACVRIAVDLGVLTTQPDKVSSEEREWLRKNIHYIKMEGNPKLNMELGMFNSWLSSR